MVETDPINVTITTDTSDLKTGAAEGSRALENFGASAERFGTSIRAATTDSRALFRGLVEMRVALMSTEHVMKLLGVQNEYVTKTFEVMNAVVDIAITLAAIERAARFAVAAARWVSAKAGFAEAAAEESIATGGFGTPVAVAEGVAAIGVFAGLVALARGGIVMRPTLAMVGERGPEAVIPLEKMGTAAGAGIGDTIIHMNVYSNDPDYISRQLARLIEQRKIAGY